MTIFADLHLCAPREPEKIKGMIMKSYNLGYHLIGVSLPTSLKPDAVEQLHKFCFEVGIDFATRIDLTPSNPKELLSYLRQLRRRFEVISVHCCTKPIARQAAKDRRVDLLSFPSYNPRDRFFDRSAAELASKSSISFEINMAQILCLESFQRVRLLTSLRREVAVAQSLDVPITISSGATNEYLLRKPLDYAALTKLFDMDSSLAVKSLSEVPLAIIKRNRLKLSPEFVAPGVRVIRREGADSQS